MVSVMVTAMVGDLADASPAVVLFSVVSNEPDDARGLGDGATVNDIQSAETGTADFNLLLRCERDGFGFGREYTVCYIATDDAGNTTTDCAVFSVPHDLSGDGGAAILSGQKDFAGSVQPNDNTAKVMVRQTQSEILPSKIDLVGNYPNPFNPTTTIQYALPKGSKVELKIYNILGQVVRKLVDEEKPAGFHQTIWDGRDETGRPVSTGIYLYQIRAGDFVQTKKMQLVK